MLSCCQKEQLISLGDRYGLDTTLPNEHYIGLVLGELATDFRRSICGSGLGLVVPEGCDPLPEWALGGGSMPRSRAQTRRMGEATKRLLEYENNGTSGAGGLGRWITRILPWPPIREHDDSDFVYDPETDELVKRIDDARRTVDKLVEKVASNPIEDVIFPEARPRRQ